MTRWNQLSGKVADERREVNYLRAIPVVVAKTRASNRESRREKDREVRLELKRINQALATLDPESDKFKELDLRKSELDLFEASPHQAANKPYTKDGE